MESKQELTQMITRLGGERRQYLNDFLEDCPEELVRAIQYEKIPRRAAILQAGMDCSFVWGIINGEISVTDIQMLGNVYSFVESSGFSIVIIGDYEPFAVSFLHYKTTKGYELRAVGSNRDAAEFAGIDVGKNMVQPMLIGTIVFLIALKDIVPLLIDKMGKRGVK